MSAMSTVHWLAEHAGNHAGHQKDQHQRTGQERQGRSEPVESAAGLNLVGTELCQTACGLGRAESECRVGCVGACLRVQNGHVHIASGLRLNSAVNRLPTLLRWVTAR